MIKDTEARVDYLREIRGIYADSEAILERIDNSGRHGGEVAVALVQLTKAVLVLAQIHMRSE